MQIFNYEATQEAGENARLSSFIGAIAVGDLVKTTLGPKGMDKLLIPSGSTGSNEPLVTNDGATILKSIMLDNAAAKVLVNLSKTQDDEIGDGTTSVTIFAAELLRQADALINQHIHPQLIVKGYRLACKEAVEALTKHAVDNKNDQTKFKEDLINIAKTTLSSKILKDNKQKFAELAVEAVLRLNGSTDLDNIQIIKKAGGKLSESFLSDGFILNKSIGVDQPKRITNAKILIANTAMDTDKVKIYGAKVKASSTLKLGEIERVEKKKMEEKVERIKSHNINCFINRQLIYNYPEMLFAQSNIMAIEHADFDGVERLAHVLNAEIASTFDHPELVKLGHCDLIEEIDILDETMIKFSGIKTQHNGGNTPGAMTIVLIGSSMNILDEAERSLHDALCVLSQTVSCESRVVYGGGCAEMLMSKAVEELSTKTTGKCSVAVEAFSKALRQLPTCIADNGGYDSAELVSQLRSAHYNNKTTTGLNMEMGILGDMSEMGITESFKMKRHMVIAASEAAEMIVRVDNILRSAPRRRERA